MTVNVNLNEWNIITLDSHGNGTAKVGPLTAYEEWQPATASVNVSSNNNEAQCSVFMGDRPTLQNFVGQTLSGSTGDSTGLSGAVPLKTGQYVYAVWSGGDPGASATLKVQGSKLLASHS